MTGNSPGNLWRTRNRRRALITLLVVLIGIAFYFLLYRSKEVGAAFRSLTSALAPVLIGLVLAYLLNPLQTRIQRGFVRLFGKRAKHPRRVESAAKGVSIGLSVLLLAALLVWLVVLILPEIGNSIARVAEVLPAQVRSAADWINGRLKDDSEWAVVLQQGLEKGLEFLQNWATTSLPGVANSLLSYVTTGVIGVVKSVFNLVVAMVVAIYVLKDKHRFLAQSKKLLCAFAGERRANQVLDTSRHAHKIIGGYLTGIIIESLIVGVLCFIAMTLMRMPYALLVSVIIGVTNVIPFFGPIIGAVLSSMLILLSDFRKGLIFILFIIILQQIEGNIIAPRVLGESTGVSPFWVTFSLLLFGSLFGVVGMLIGVPLFAVLYYLIGLWVDARLESRNLPTDTQAYTTAVGLADGQLVHAPPLQPADRKETKPAAENKENTDDGRN